MPKFRVIGGKFRNLGGDGKTYRKGAVVESPYDLDLKFVNKFFRVPDSTPVGPADGDPVKVAANQDRTFQINNVPFVAPPNLSPGELQEWTTAMEELRVKQEGAEKVKTAVPGDKPSSASEEAVDVTSDFKTAQEADLVVHRRNKFYFVAEKDKPDVPLHEAPFTNKRAVAEFIAEQSSDPNAGKTEE